MRSIKVGFAHPSRVAVLATHRPVRRVFRPRASPPSTAAPAAKVPAGNSSARATCLRSAVVVQCRHSQRIGA